MGRVGCPYRPQGIQKAVCRKSPLYQHYPNCFVRFCFQRMRSPDQNSIALDQPVIELETDKALVEVPSSLAGKVLTVDVKEGDRVPAGAQLITIEEYSDSPSDRPTPEQDNLPETPAGQAAPFPAHQRAPRSRPRATADP